MLSVLEYFALVCLIVPKIRLESLLFKLFRLLLEIVYSECRGKLVNLSVKG